MDFQNEMARLDSLRQKLTAVLKGIGDAREQAARAHRQISGVRVAAVLDPDANPPKAAEASIKKLEVDLRAAEAQAEKLTPEADILRAAIARVEAEAIPARHVERLRRQKQVRSEYRDAAARVLRAADEMVKANTEAQRLLDAASAEFPDHELLEGHERVWRYAGLLPVADAAWVEYRDNWTRRDGFVEAAWRFDKTLVDAREPVAVKLAHQEKFEIEYRERLEGERLRLIAQREAEVSASVAKWPGSLGEWTGRAL